MMRERCIASTHNQYSPNRSVKLCKFALRGNDVNIFDGCLLPKRGGSKVREAPPGAGRTRLSAHGYFSRNPLLALSY